jgi:hypothetical protein
MSESEVRSGMRRLSGKITVNVGVEMTVTDWLQDQITVPGKAKMSTKIVHCISMSPIWIVDTPGKHADSH